MTLYEDDLWDHSSTDHEEAKEFELVSTALSQSSQILGFLVKSESATDFNNRLDLMSDNIHSVASQVAGEGTVGYTTLVTKLPMEFFSKWQVAADSRQKTAPITRGGVGLKRVAVSQFDEAAVGFAEVVAIQIETDNRDLESLFFAAFKKECSSRGINPGHASDALDMSLDLIIDDAASSIGCIAEIAKSQWRAGSSDLYLWPKELGQNCPISIESSKKFSSREDYSHWNEEADQVWWQEEGQFGSEEPEYCDICGYPHVGDCPDSKIAALRTRSSSNRELAKQASRPSNLKTGSDKQLDAWVCTDCLFLNEYGEVESFEGSESEYKAYVAEFNRRMAGYDWVAGDNTREFSKSMCDGCGSFLSGARHELIGFPIGSSPKPSSNDVKQSFPQQHSLWSTSSSWPPKDDAGAGSNVDPSNTVQQNPQSGSGGATAGDVSQGSILVDVVGGDVHSYEVSSVTDQGDSVLLDVIKDGSESMNLLIPKGEQVKMLPSSAPAPQQVAEEEVEVDDPEEEPDATNQEASFNPFAGNNAGEGDKDEESVEEEDEEEVEEEDEEEDEEEETKPLKKKKGSFRGHRSNGSVRVIGNLNDFH